MGRSRRWFKSVRTKLLLCTSHSTHPDETFVVFHTNEASNTPFSQEIVVPPKDQINDPPTQEIIIVPTEEIVVMPPKDQREDAPQDQDGAINSTIAPHAVTSEIITMSSTDHQIAVIKIQTSFRAHLARRAYKALKGLVKLQAVVRGMCVRRQVQLAMNCMNTLARLQITVRSHQLLTESNLPSHASRPPSATQ